MDPGRVGQLLHPNTESLARLDDKDMERRTERRRLCTQEEQEKEEKRSPLGRQHSRASAFPHELMDRVWSQVISPGPLGSYSTVPVDRRSTIDSKPPGQITLCFLSFTSA